MRQIRITIMGAAGRMGQELLQCIQESEDFEAVGLVVEAGSPLTATSPPWAGHLVCVDDVREAAQEADVLLDFTSPSALDDLLSVACQQRLPLVCGTTGYSQVQFDHLRRAGLSIPVFYSPNMSVGIHVLASLVDLAVRALGPGYDVEILETHHRFKKDAPSGTALRLASVASNAGARSTGEREGMPAPEGPLPVPIHSIRGGDIVGDHAVHLMGLGERLEIVHRAGSRRTFALGALRAARWLLGQPPGFYSMADLLGSTPH